MSELMQAEGVTDATELKTVLAEFWSLLDLKWVLSSSGGSRENVLSPCEGR